jgi:hypothetical protein
MNQEKISLTDKKKGRGETGNGKQNCKRIGARK